MISIFEPAMLAQLLWRQVLTRCVCRHLYVLMLGKRLDSNSKRVYVFR